MKEQVQSEYWHIKYYSLLISISRFLVTTKWNDRKSPLGAKSEVTVQREFVAPNTTIYTKGSFIATIVHGSNEEGEDVQYTLCLADGSHCQMPRNRLRHRVWHTVAFLWVTNEKQHVSTTTQAFHARQLDFWRCWHEAGRDAAIAYAFDDRAGVPRSSEGQNQVVVCLYVAPRGSERRGALLDLLIASLRIWCVPGAGSSYSTNITARRC